MIEQVHPRREAATVSCMSSSSNACPTSALKDASTKLKRDLCLQDSLVVLNSLVNSLYSASIDSQSQVLPSAEAVAIHIPFTLEMEKDLLVGSEEEIVELDLNAGLDLEPVQSCGHNSSRCAKPCMAGSKSSHTVNTAITTPSTQFNDSFGNLSLDDCDTEHTRNTSLTAPAVMTNRKRHPRSPCYFASPQSHPQPRHSRHYQSQMPMLKQSSSKSDSSFLSSPSPRRQNLSRNKSDPLDECMSNRQNRGHRVPRQQRRNRRSTDLDDDAQHSPLRPDHYYSSRSHQPGRHHLLEQKRQRDARISRSDRNKKATSRSLSPKKEESSLTQPQEGPAFRRTSTDPGTADANVNTSTTEILIEVQPGVHVPLRRTHEVEHALKLEFYQTLACSHCTDTCTIIANAAFVHCPHCKLISPVVGAVMANQGQEVAGTIQMSDDASSSSNEEGRYGLALGMTWDTIEKVHQEWFHPRD